MTVSLAPAVELGDVELMVRVQADDPDAFGALYDRFGARAYRVAYAISRDGTRAEDIVQEAFLSVWRSRAAYQPQRGTVTGWVMGTVRNRAIDSFRRNGPHDSRRAGEDHIDERLQAPGSLEETTGERDQAARLRGVLGQLPRRAARGDRSRLLRRAEHYRDRQRALPSPRHDQGPHAFRPAKAPYGRSLRTAGAVSTDKEADSGATRPRRLRRTVTRCE